MLGAERPPARPVTSLKEILGFRESALAPEHVPEVSEDEQGVRVVVAKNLEAGGQDCAIESLGIGEPALTFEVYRQVFHNRQGEWSIRAVVATHAGC
jgi:hypothetical protein